MKKTPIDSWMNEISDIWPLFKKLDQEWKSRIIENASVVDADIGQILIKPGVIPGHVYLVLSGKIRYLGTDLYEDGPISIAVKEKGELAGWAGLLRGGPCDYVIASEKCRLLAIKAKDFCELYDNCEIAREEFNQKSGVGERYYALLKNAYRYSKIGDEWREKLLQSLEKGEVKTFDNLNQLDKKMEEGAWILSSEQVELFEAGSEVDNSVQSIKKKDGFKWPIRLISFDGWGDNSYSGVPRGEVKIKKLNDLATKSEDLASLGVFESESLKLEEKYPFVRGKGDVEAAYAAIQMVCLYQEAPFRGEVAKRLINDHKKRGKRNSLELIGVGCELMGLSCQIASTHWENVNGIELPVVIFIDDTPCVLVGFKSGMVLVANPKDRIKAVSPRSLPLDEDGKLKFLLCKKTAATPGNSFSFSWFVPLLKKYKKSLALIFGASLLAQLFGLAIPLLLQQIIDKVLTQGNLSSLNVLGATMVILALFQGILQALRTYIFVDTTDRMDMTLGSAVIDRLLSLPLNYFEKRPVGELSQRLGELNNIRSFLTGTALISILNIVFAAIYLIVMIIYSPILSVVALSTFPLYLALVFGVAPIYKRLIRKKAVAAAKTQSHLIEVIGGIQTVKAQNFEINARWKWQDRYKEFVTEGYKSTVLGSSAGEVGNFLNSVSGLLVLWFGMSLVLKGEFTLGQLIAFRIISSNVTGPLLQLAGLYQGFQGVQLSMERLGDILNQTPEMTKGGTFDQIGLPPISGNVKIEDVSFKFPSSKIYQLNKVNLTVEAGQFVGIVGRSGSGKSTLMKLIPRLYDLENGRIVIDDYDISKVDIISLRKQIGIVPQDSLLFDGTVFDNIALNDPQATTEEVIDAAKIACCHDFIMDMGQGYASEIVEKGANLSGGQRQRIAIARTILSNPKMLILDEATSALDYETEGKLCSNLHEWAENRTVFFITHRLATIKNSDKVVLMDSGSIEEIGTHEELINQRGRYYSLYKQQDITG